MNQKGQMEVRTTTLLFELIIGILIASLMWYGIVSTTDKEIYDQAYVNQDFLMIHNMIEGMPGDLDYEYRTSGFAYDSEKKSFVREKGDWTIKITKRGRSVSLSDPQQIESKTITEQ